MTEFFKNLVQWFIENKDSVFTSTTIINIVGISTAIITFIKQLKATNKNTERTNVAVNLLSKAQNMQCDIIALSQVITECNDKISNLYNIQNNNDTNFKNIDNKINAMLDVQEMVYSTINDDTLRKGIKNTIIKAKTDETDTIAELKEKLAELQNKLNTATEELQKELNKTVESLPTVEEKHIVVEEENKIVRA